MRNLSIYNIRYIGFPLSVLCIQFIISCVPFILLSSNAALLRCLLPSSIHCPVANSYSLVFISFIFSSGCSACKRLPLLMLSFFSAYFICFCVFIAVYKRQRAFLCLSHFILYYIRLSLMHLVYVCHWCFGRFCYRTLQDIVGATSASAISSCALPSFLIFCIQKFARLFHHFLLEIELDKIFIALLCSIPPRKIQK